MDPRNQPNCQVGSNTLVSLAIIPNPRGDAVHKHALGSLGGLKLAAFAGALDGTSSKPEIFKIPGVCHWLKPSAREF